MFNLLEGRLVPLIDSAEDRELKDPFCKADISSVSDSLVIFVEASLFSMVFFRGASFSSPSSIIDELTTGGMDDSTSGTVNQNTLPVASRE